MKTICVIACVVVSMSCGVWAGTAAGKPNVLFIVSDDQGWNDIGYHNPELRTPNLDALARAGVELDAHYVQPQCTPTRVALMTGRYPSRFGKHCTQASNERSYAIGTLTMAHMFKSMGYATGMSGKWHMGSLPKWGPNHHGFDYSHGSLAGAVGMYDHRYRLNRPEYTQTWHRNHEFITEVGHVTDLTANEAVRWINEHRGEPWFFYVPFHAVHTPLIEGDTKWHHLNKHIADPDRRLFAAAVSHMDAAVGRMVEALEKTGQRKRTIIVFTSDNGGIAGAYPGGNYPPPDTKLAKGFSSNAPLRGGKTTAYEGGIRVPALINYPGKLPAHKLTTPMHAVDWMPTLAGVVGYKPEQDPAWDGQNVWPMLVDAEHKPAPRTIYWVWGPRRWEALRDGDWKIVRNGAHKPWQLYDLAADPNEQTNLAQDRRDVVLKLVEKYKAERAKDGW